MSPDGPPPGPDPVPPVEDERVERALGTLLRHGVLIAGAVTVLGGFLALTRGGGAAANFATFHGEPEPFRSIAGIVSGARGLDPRSVIQLGIVCLIATPVLRVALSLVAFAMRRDRIYVVVTAIVLALLAVSLFSARG